MAKSIIKITAALLVCVFANSAMANDFPTIERVKYVHECMALNGGFNYVNMYNCSCMIDKIAENISFQEYAQDDAFKRLKSMRGERGGYFRSSSHSRKARKKLKNIERAAKASCFVSAN